MSDFQGGAKKAVTQKSPNQNLQRIGQNFKTLSRNMSTNFFL